MGLGFEVPSEHSSAFRFFSGEIEDWRVGHSALAGASPHLVHLLSWKDVARTSPAQRKRFISEEMLRDIPSLSQLRPDIEAEPVELLPFCEKSLDEARKKTKKSPSKLMSEYEAILTSQN